MLLKEPNYRRRAQRIDLPLLVQVKEKVYKSKDWSILGIGIFDFDIPFENNAEVNSKLILPLQGASFTFPVTLVLKNQHGNITGCEFANLSLKNKKVLRRFIELSIEGRLDNVDDIIAAHSGPVLDTPIQEAICLDQKETTDIKRDFYKKSIAYILTGLIVASVIYYAVIYNIQYKIFATGVITGSTMRITANNHGILEKIYANNHEEIKKGHVLFDTLVTVEKEVEVENLDDKELMELSKQTNTLPVQFESSLIDMLDKRYISKNKQYQDAIELYNKRLITKKDINIIHNNMMSSKLDLERERIKVEEKNKMLKMNIERLNDKIKDLKRTNLRKVETDEIKRRISPVDGKVFRIEHNEGEYVQPGDTILVLQTTDKPYVIMKLHSRDIYKIKINDNANIFTKYSDKIYSGKITQIGYAAVNANVPISQETSLNESLVKIEFDDENVTFPINTRVEVKVIRNYF